MKIIFLAAIFLFTARVYGDSMSGNSKVDQGTQGSGGGAAVGAGAAYAAIGCPFVCPVNPPTQCSTTLCINGIAGIIEGLITMGKASSNTKPSRDAVQGGGGFNGVPCAGGGTNCIDNPLANLTSNVDPATAKQIKDLAKIQGVNLDDPASVSDFMASNSGGLDSAGAAKAIAALSPEMQAKLAKMKQDVLNKYHVADVPLEGGGGGGGFHKPADSFNLDGFLKGMNSGNEGADRNPASVAGLQRSFGGEPVGVSADDIFKQVSRKYSSKIKSQSFLAAPK